MSRCIQIPRYPSLFFSKSTPLELWLSSVSTLSKSHIAFTSVAFLIFVAENTKPFPLPPISSFPLWLLYHKPPNHTRLVPTTSTCHRPLFSTNELFTNTSLSPQYYMESSGTPSPRGLQSPSAATPRTRSVPRGSLECLVGVCFPRIEELVPPGTCLAISEIWAVCLCCYLSAWFCFLENDYYCLLPTVHRHNIIQKKIHQDFIIFTDIWLTILEVMLE